MVKGLPFIVVGFLCFGIGGSYAQVVEQEASPVSESVSEITEDKSVTWYDYPEAELRALDKITAQATTFKVKVGKPAKFGGIYMKVQACRKPAAIDKVDSAAFVQVWEKRPKQEASEWVFSGWMFGSSPSLSAMDHSIYDVWLLDCIGDEPKIIAEHSDEAVSDERALEGDANESLDKKSSFDSMLEGLENRVGGD